MAASGRIAEALRLVQIESDHIFDDTAAIVPLLDLLGAFPVEFETVPGLCYREAARRITGDGRDVPVLADPDQPLAGLLYAYTLGSIPHAMILVQSDTIAERQRFTVAHELGHFLMHFCPFIQPGDSEAVLLEGLNQTDKEALDDPAEAASIAVMPVSLSHAEMEREANAFAAALLMPEPACRACFEIYRTRYGNHRNVVAHRMATDFLVSRTAMFWRLTDLDLGTTS